MLQADLCKDTLMKIKILLKICFKQTTCMQSRYFLLHHLLAMSRLVSLKIATRYPLVVPTETYLPPRHNKLGLVKILFKIVSCKKYT
jgi:hypothetical protein